MKLLILGGTGEARRLAEAAAALGQMVIYSLAGRTAKAREPAGCTVRIGGFGGDAQFLQFANSFDAIIDATHPFAANMHRRTALLSNPSVRLQRPCWKHQGHSWETVTALVQHLSSQAPQRIFLALGSYGWQPFERLTNHQFFLRGLEPLTGLPPHLEYHQGKPGTLNEERALFEQLNLDGLIVRNAGGEQGQAKLEAAAQLGMRLNVIERPPLPTGLKVVTSESDTLDWLSRIESR